MIDNVDYDVVAGIIKPALREDDKQLKLDICTEEAPAESYYDMLSTVVGMIDDVRAIIENLPAGAMDAANAGITLEYKDDVIKGAIRLKGGNRVEEGTV